MKYIPRYYNGLWYVTTGHIHLWSTGKNRKEAHERCDQLNNEVKATEKWAMIAPNDPPTWRSTRGPVDEPIGDYTCLRCKKDIGDEIITDHGMCQECFPC